MRRLPPIFFVKRSREYGTPHGDHFVILKDTGSGLDVHSRGTQIVDDADAMQKFEHSTLHAWRLTRDARDKWLAGEDSISDLDFCDSRPDAEGEKS